MAVDFLSGFVGFLAGIAVTVPALYHYLKSRISPSEAYEIYQKVKKTIEDYNTAMQDGNLSEKEKLELAQDTLAILQELLEALES